MSHDCEDDGHGRCERCGRCEIVAHSGKRNSKEWWESCLYYLEQDKRFLQTGLSNWRESCWAVQGKLNALEYALGFDKTMLRGEGGLAEVPWKVCPEEGCENEPEMLSDYCPGHTTPERKTAWSERLHERLKEEGQL